MVINKKKALFIGLAGYTLYLGGLHAESLEEVLAKVEARAPDTFPEQNVPLPEPDQMAKASVGVLVAGLDSWNPSMRVAIAKELSVRLRTSPSKLYGMADSDHPYVRAGIISAISELVSWKRRNWKEAFPSAKDNREAEELLRADKALEQILVKAASDDEIDVRSAALGGLGALGSESDEVVIALLKLTSDPDPYLAQRAMEALGKGYVEKAANLPEAIPPLKKAMSSPLPRGRGMVVGIIEKMDEESQREFIPELIAHLEWIPDRDTMFGAGGQISAVKILTKLRAEELLPVLPGIINKTVRGSDMLPASMESARAFGKEAKVIIPDLKREAAKMAPTEEELKSKNGKSLSDRHKIVTDTIEYLEKL